MTYYSYFMAKKFIGLAQVVTTQNSQGETFHTCPICKESYDRKRYTERHIYAEKHYLPEECPNHLYCEFMSANESKYNDHVKICTIVKCDRCPRLMLSDHVAKHLSTCPIKCKNYCCTFEAFSKDEMKNHECKLVLCSICDTNFASYILETHKISCLHSHVKKTCRYCLEEIPRKDLVEHYNKCFVKMENTYMKWAEMLGEKFIDKIKREESKESHETTWDIMEIPDQFPMEVINKARAVLKIRLAIIDLAKK